MQVVIEISDTLMEYIVKGKDLSEEQNDEMALVIAKGTPLPKGHGKLKDADELYLDIQTDEEMRLGEHLEWVKDRFDNAPTIIEARYGGE